MASTNGRLFEKQSLPLIPKPLGQQPLMTVKVTHHNVQDISMDLLSLLSQNYKLIAVRLSMWIKDHEASHLNYLQDPSSSAALGAFHS
jgi:hypothetical protein